MRNKTKLITLFISLLLLIGLFTACSNNDSSTVNSNEKKDLTFGCMALTEPMLNWLGEGLEEKGYNVEVKTFSGNHLPAVALDENNIDGLILNYRPWLITFNEENDTDLYMVEPYIYFGFSALFSNKIDSIEDLPENATVAVAGDPTNFELSLMMLEDAGLIKLGEKSGNFYSKIDIIENPKNINIMETEVTQTARYIDEADLVGLDSGTAAEAGIDTNSYIFPSKEMIEEEMASTNKASNYDETPIFIDPDFGLIIRGEDKEEEWVKDCIEVYQSEEFREKFNDYYGGAYILYNN